MVEPTPAAPTPAAEACMCRFVDLVDIEISGFIFLFIVNTLTISDGFDGSDVHA